jgi:hypothetical protein
VIICYHIIRWDKTCLQPGVSWEKGIYEGLILSRVFVPILSREAINHPTESRQNFSMLTTDSPCDNVLLEYLLALELSIRGLVEKIYPIMFGDELSNDAGVTVYGNYFALKCNPSLPGTLFR